MKHLLGKIPPKAAAWGIRVLILFAAYLLGYEAGHLRSALTVTTSLSQVTEPAAGDPGTEQNWGLSFPVPGETPVGNASPEALAQKNAYFVDTSGEKVIYLTFDAGYENGNTGKILDALKTHGAKATFFVVGNFLKEQPDLIRRMVEEGHTVGNHTYHHPDMAKMATEENFLKELQDLEQLYEETTGEKMVHFYRPPQGKYSESNLDMAKAAGYRTFFWSLAYVDWYEDKQPTYQEAYDKLLPRIHPGAIVLLHSTSATNGEILDTLLTRWEEMGYTFRSLEEFPFPDTNTDRNTNEKTEENLPSTADTKKTAGINSQLSFFMT